MPDPTRSQKLRDANAGLTKRNALVEIGRSGLPASAGYVTADFDRTLRGHRGVAFWEEFRQNDAMAAGALSVIDQTLRGVRWHAVAKDLPEGSTPEEKAKIAEQVKGQPTPGMEQAQWLDTCLDDMSQSWPDFISEALTHLPFGWALHEVVYKVRAGEAADPPSKYDDGKLGWRKIPLRGQNTLDRWEFDPAGGIAGMWQRDANTFEPYFIPIEKALLIRTTRERNNPEGRSILRGAARAYYQKKNFEEILAIGAERDLTGLLHITLPADATDEDFATAERMAERVKVDDQAGIITQNFGVNDHENWHVELLSSPGSKTIDVEAAIHRCADEIAIVLASEFLRLGLNGRGSLALAQVQAKQFRNFLGGILLNLKETFNRFLVAPLLQLNGQPVLCELTHDPLSDDDLDALANFVSKLASAGFLTANAETEQALRGAGMLPELSEADMAKRKEVENAKHDQTLQLIQNPPPPMVPGAPGQGGPPQRGQQAPANPPPVTKAEEEADGGLLAEILAAIEKYNHNHGPDGRFSSTAGASFVSFKPGTTSGPSTAASGRSPATGAGGSKPAASGGKAPQSAKVEKVPEKPAKAAPAGGKAWDSHWDAWGSSLSGAERSAVQDYSGGDYKAINTALRKGNKPPANVAKIDAALAKGSLPADTMLYRGGGPRGLKPGQTFSDKAFTSTSADKGTAQSWARFHDVPLMHISAPKGTKGGYVANIAQFGKAEKEFLLPRGMTYRVTKVERATRTRPETVHVEIVPE